MRTQVYNTSFSQYLHECKQDDLEDKCYIRLDLIKQDHGASAITDYID